VSSVTGIIVGSIIYKCDDKSWQGSVYGNTKRNTSTQPKLSLYIIGQSSCPFVGTVDGLHGCHQYHNYFLPD
jgi:hypothetical protein